MNKKKIIILLSALITYVVVTLGLIYGLQTIKLWYGIIFGIGMMLFALFFHLFAKTDRKLYLFSLLFNSIGTGFTISVYYTVFGFTPTINEMMIAITVGLTTLFLFNLLMHNNIFFNHGRLIVGTVILLALASSIFIWINNNNNLSSLIFFYLFVSYFHMIGIVKFSLGKKDILKEISLVSFGFAIAISIVVLIILSEGEALEGLDGLSVSTGKNKKNI